MQNFVCKIDVTVCLSLPNRTDRRQSMNYPIDLPTIEWFDAYTPKTTIVPGSWSHLPSYFATTLGHLRILEQLWLRDDWTTALILEDDALFLPYASQLQNYLQELDNVRPDWLGTFLGWHLQQPATKVNDQVYITNGNTMSHAYVIRRHGLWRMYDHLWCCQHEIVDWAYCHLAKQDSAFFIPAQQMITTAAGFSDNGQGYKRQGT